MKVTESNIILYTNSLSTSKTAMCGDTCCYSDQLYDPLLQLLCAETRAATPISCTIHFCNCYVRRHVLLLRSATGRTDSSWWRAVHGGHPGRTASRCALLAAANCETSRLFATNKLQPSRRTDVRTTEYKSSTCLQFLYNHKSNTTAQHNFRQFQLQNVLYYNT